LLHVAPVETVNGVGVVDVRELARSKRRLWPMGSSGCNHRYNASGWLTFSGHDSYLQCFRSGLIETVDSNAVRVWEGKRVLSGSWIAGQVALSASEALAALQDVGGFSSFLVALTLTGAQGAQLLGDSHYHMGEPIDEDILELPESLIESDVPANEESVLCALRPAFDTLWQAAGKPSCPHYNSDGNWDPTPRR
jgi:hypothetical protein